MNIGSDSCQNSDEGIGCRFLPRRGNLGFTLIELLVVIAIIAILAALLLPALRASREIAQGVCCLGQIKQFSYAWNMYADDNEEWIPPNYSSGGPAQIDTNTWVRGWLDNGFTCQFAGQHQHPLPDGEPARTVSGALDCHLAVSGR